MTRLGEVLAALDSWYPPRTAESWDSVGLTCGDPDESLDTVLCAVDCVPDTVAEAERLGAGLLLTHHPLLLTAVHDVATTSPKGAMVHRMIRAGIAHFAAHTNADIAVGGVSEALANRLGVLSPRPLDPAPREAMDHLAVFVPVPGLQSVVDAVTAAGAGALGDYDSCTFTVEGIGTFRPLPGAAPAIGAVGELTRVAEARLSVILPRRRRARVLAAMRSAHPYEEVAFELTEQPALDSSVGGGRIGRLAAPTTLRDFVDHVALVLPSAAWGVRAAGAPQRRIETVAVCGGAGGSYTEAARAAGADVFVTADLRHHTTSESVTERDAVESMALVDAGHWTTERPWLDVVAARLSAEFGDRLRVGVSSVVTDPFTLHAPTPHLAD